LGAWHCCLLVSSSAGARGLWPEQYQRKRAEGDGQKAMPYYFPSHRKLSW
jgi:hypothetical protein